MVKIKQNPIEKNNSVWEYQIIVQFGNIKSGLEFYLYSAPWCNINSIWCCYLFASLLDTRAISAGHLASCYILIRQPYGAHGSTHLWIQRYQHACAKRIKDKKSGSDPLMLFFQYEGIILRLCLEKLKLCAKLQHVLVLIHILSFLVLAKVQPTSLALPFG